MEPDADERDARSIVVRSRRVVLPRRVAPASIEIRHGRIRTVRSGNTTPRSGGARLLVDAGSALIAPGFIDTQINGAFGIDLVESPSLVWELAAGLARHGVTAFLATLPSHDPALGALEGLAAALDAPPDDDVVRARPVGIHLEGPFLAPRRRGAHPAEAVRPVDLRAVESWLSSAPVAMVTLAPELEGALDVATRLAESGVVVAVGHTEADASVLDAAARVGATHVTHLWNAMAGVHHRDPGTVGTVLVDRRFTAGLICDGHHVADEVIDLTWRMMGPDRLVVVSDAVAEAGAGGPDSAAVGPDGVLRGGLGLLDASLRVLRRATDAPVGDALAAVTTNPARLIGRPDLGVLAPGAAADLVVLDDGLVPLATMIGGRWVDGIDGSSFPPEAGG